LLLKFILFLALVTLSQSLLLAETTLNRNLAPPAMHSNLLDNSNWYVDILKRDLYEGLMSRDIDGKLIYGNTKSVKIQGEGVEYIFTLREDAKWSNGKDVTAYDYEFTYKYMINLKNDTQTSFYLEEIQIKNASKILKGELSVEMLGVKALDKKTLLITLEQPSAYFLNALAAPLMFPFPQHSINNSEYKNDKISTTISNGAYTVKRIIKNKKIILAKNPYYYDKKRVSIDKVIYNIVTGTKALNLYKKNKLDIVTDIPKNRVNYITKHMPNQYNTYLINGNYFLSFNLKKEIFQNKQVRKALSYAIDREVIANKVMGSGEKALYSLIPASFLTINYKNQFYKKILQRRREKIAKDLLLKSGYSPKKPLKFKLLYNKNEYNTRTLLAIVSMWRQVFKGSIKVKLVSKPWNTYIQELQEYPICRTGWVADYEDASSMFSIFNKFNPFFSEKKLSKTLQHKLKSISVEPSKEKRDLIYQQLDKAITEEFVLIPLFQLSSNTLVKPYVHGYRTNKLDTLFSKYLSIEKH